MAEPAITLIVPTIGRPTLARCLASLRRQTWRVEDEVLLVGDGPQPSARYLWDQFALPGRYLEVAGPYSDWGHTPRNRTMPRARGDYIAALDDDDQWVPDALVTIRAACAQALGRPLMFRMHGAPCGGTVWKSRELKHGNVGTPMFVLPAAGQRWGCYEPFHGGDAAFIQQTLALWPPRSLVWRPEVIALIRPHLEQC